MAVGIMPINEYFTAERPDVLASAENVKAICFSTLEKVCWVAMIAIMGTVFFFAYGGIALSSTASLFLVGGALSIPFWAWGLSKFRTLANEHESKSMIENGVAEQLEQIKDWTEAQVIQFLKEEEVYRGDYGSAIPFQPFLPIIARYKYYKNQADALEARAQELLTEQNFGQIEDLSALRIHRAACRKQGWELHEKWALPMKFEAAVLLEVMRRGPEANAINLNQLGRFTYNTLENRLIDRHYGPIDETCFQFSPDMIRPNPLILRYLDNKEPRQIRPILYDNNCYQALFA
jgi:hypothetical protein